MARCVTVCSSASFSPDCIYLRSVAPLGVQICCPDSDCECLICRDGSSDDPRDQPGNGNVLGNFPLELNGDYGGSGRTVEEIISLVQNRTSQCEVTLNVCVDAPQEAYSVARQFNLIPPICEQAEYHMFQREKVEVQLPELFHKIGVCLCVPIQNQQCPQVKHLKEIHYPKMYFFHHLLSCHSKPV